MAVEKYTEIDISKRSYDLFMAFRNRVTCNGAKNMDEDEVFQQAIILAARQYDYVMENMISFPMVPPVSLYDKRDFKTVTGPLIGFGNPELNKIEEKDYSENDE